MPCPSDQVVFVNFSPEEKVIFWNSKGDGVLATIKSINLVGDSNLNIKPITIVTDSNNSTVDTTVLCISKLLNPSQIQNLNLHRDHTKKITTGNLLLLSIPHKSRDEAENWISDILTYCNSLSCKQKCFVLKRLEFYVYYYLTVCNNAQWAYQAISSILNKEIERIERELQNQSVDEQTSYRNISQHIASELDFNAFHQPRQLPFYRPHGATKGYFKGPSGLFYLNAPQFPTASWDTPAVVESRPQTNIREAQIWYCQASADLQVCEHLVDTTSLDTPSTFQQCQHPALVCFLSHEVIEKCLKALCLATCGLGKDLRDTENVVVLYNYLSQHLGDKTVEECIHQVSEYDRSTRFPDAHVPSEPPCCVYDGIDAYNALVAAKKVMKYAKDTENDLASCTSLLVWSSTLRKS